MVMNSKPAMRRSDGFLSDILAVKDLACKISSGKTEDSFTLINFVLRVRVCRSGRIGSPGAAQRHGKEEKEGEAGEAMVLVRSRLNMLAFQTSHVSQQTTSQVL